MRMCLWTNCRLTGVVWISANAIAAVDIRKRRGPGSTSSGIGIRSMKQMLHLPGLGEVMCGCIEQYQVVAFCLAAAASLEVSPPRRATA
jgi:hypothetical protein